MRLWRCMVLLAVVTVFPVALVFGSLLDAGNRSLALVVAAVMWLELCVVAADIWRRAA